MTMHRWIPLAALLLALPASAEAQSARSRLGQGGVDGMEMTLEGALQAPRGDALRWAITAYEVRGLSDLRPAAGASVHVATSLDRTEDAASETTDAGGRATVSVAVPDDAPASFQVVIRLVSASGVQRRFDLSVQATDPDALSVHAARPQVRPGGPLRAFGRLASRRTGRPRAGQTVRLTLRDDQRRPLAAPAEVQTDEAGLYAHVFTVPDDAAGGLVITAETDDEDHPVRATARSAAGEPTSAALLVAVAPERWVLSPRETVGVDVVVRTPNGRPVSGAVVTLPGARREDSERRAITDGRGRARLRWHAPGFSSGIRDAAIQVQATREGRGSAAGAATVRIAASSYAAGLSVEGGAIAPSIGGRVFVRVVDATGHPAGAGVEVRATGPRLGSDVTARTDAAGVATLDLRLQGAPDATSDRCGGETATALEIRVGGGSEGATLTPCLPLDPDAAARIRVTAPRVGLEDAIEIELERVAGAARAPVEVTVLRPVGGQQELVSQTIVPAGERTASLPAAAAEGILHVLARPLVGATRQVVRGGSAAVWVTPGAPARAEAQLGPDGVTRVRFAGAAGPRSTLVVAAPIDEARSLADALRAATLGPLDDLRIDPSAATDALITAALAARLGPDEAAPFVLRGRDVVAVPAPANPVSAGLLRDPWRARSRFVTGRLALIYRALEQYVAGALPERVDDVAVRGARGFTFNGQILESVAASGNLGAAGATGLGGDPLTIEQLQAFDPSLTYDNVARRITRDRLFRLILAMRDLVNQSGWDLEWSRLGEPPEWMRRLMNRGVAGGHVSQRDMVDGWGRPFVLRAARGRSRFRFVDPLGDWEIVSVGPDGRAGTGDDLWDPTARILRSGTPYADAVGEDVLVARLDGVELGRASIELLQQVEPYARAGGVPTQSAGPSRQAAAQQWGGLPSVFEPPTDGLALRRPAHPGDGAGGALTRLGPTGGEVALTLDEEPRTWGAVIAAWTDDGWGAVAEASTLAGAPLIVEAPLPDRLRTDEEVALELILTNVTDRPLPLGVRTDGDGITIEAPATLRVPAGEAERATVRLRPSGSPGTGHASIVFAAEGGEAVREVRWPVARVTGDHPLRLRAAGLAHGRPWRVRFRVPEDARRATGRVVVLAPSAMAADPDLADLRQEDPALVAFSNALAGRPSDPTLWARLLRRQRGDGLVAGRDELLSSAAAAVAWSAAGEHDDDARQALARLRAAFARYGGGAGGNPAADDVARMAALLGALSSGGVPEPRAASRRRDPLAAAAAEARVGLRRTLRAHPEEPTLLARAAGALLLADPRDAYGRAMLERAARHLRDTPDDGSMVVPSERRAHDVEALGATLALAVAAHQVGDAALAERLARGALGRDHVALRAGGETAFWLLAAGAYGALGSDAESVTVRIDGATHELALEAGRAVVPLAPRPGEHEVVVDGAAGHAFVRVEAAMERPFVARDGGPLTLALEGEPGDAGTLAALELTVTARREVPDPVVDLSLPAGVEGSDALRAAMAAAGGVRSVEARSPGFLRVHLEPMADGTSRTIPLPLRWTVFGTLRGLGAVAYPLGRPGAMSAIAPSELEIARSELGDAAPAPSPGVAPGETVTLTGTLGPGDEQRPDGKYVDRFTMPFGAGGAVEVLLDSDQFDTWLRVIAPSGRVTENDDRPGGGLNSGVTVALDEPGTWTIEVTSYRAGDGGDYTVRVTGQ